MLSRRFVQSIPAQARGYASKIASVDYETGKISSLTVKVNGGSRYASKDGTAHVLSRFNFLNTVSRSALRLTRESELLGGSYSSKVTRDSIYLTAHFLKEDLPYFVNAIGDVVYRTSFRPHELPEIVIPATKYDLSVANADPLFAATEELHAISFRSDLGKPLYYDGVEKVTIEDVKEYSEKVYTKSNIEIHGKGINQNDLDRFVKDSPLFHLPEGTSLTPKSTPKFYVGAESRKRAIGQVAVAAIAVPVKPSEFATYEVLSQYLSTPLFKSYESVSHAKLNKYDQAGLFVLAFKGDSTSVSSGVKSIVSTLKKGVDISSATKYTATELALSNELKFTASDIDVSGVKDFKLGKFNYVAIGDVNNLPYADEL